MQLTAYAIFAGALLLAPATGIFPFVERMRASPFNSIFSIGMPPQGDAEYAGGRYRPVFARELAEWYCAWLGALVLAAPVAAVVALTPLWIAAPLGALPAWCWRLTRRGKRELEYVGHAAEWITAQRMGLAGYDGAAAAQRLKAGHESLFAGMTVAEVDAQLRKRRPFARCLLFALAIPVRRWPQ